jgi:hypothetical protein
MANRKCLWCPNGPGGGYWICGDGVECNPSWKKQTVKEDWGVIRVGELYFEVQLGSEKDIPEVVVRLAQIPAAEVDFTEAKFKLKKKK